MTIDAKSQEQAAIMGILDYYQQLQQTRLGAQGLLAQTHATLLQPVKEKVQRPIDKVAE